MNEENINLQKNIKDEVLKKIVSGQVGMRSKTYFLIKLLLLSLTTGLITLVSIFLLSFVIFSSSLSGSLFLIKFGSQGLLKFILSLPWLLLLVDILLLFFLDYLLKSFRFGYKSPIIYLFIGTFSLVTLTSTLVNFTSLHQHIRERAEHSKLPFVPDIYSGVGSQFQKPGTWKGYVGEIKDHRFAFSYVEGVTGKKGVAVVIAMPSVDVDKFLDEGDLVFVAGNLLNGEIKAYGIKKLNE